MTTRRLLTSTLLAVGLAGGFVRASDGPKPASTPGPGEPTLCRSPSPDRTIPGRQRRPGGGVYPRPL